MKGLQTRLAGVKIKTKETDSVLLVLSIHLVTREKSLDKHIHNRKWLILYFSSPPSPNLTSTVRKEILDLDGLLIQLHGLFILFTYYF